MKRYAIAVEFGPDAIPSRCVTHVRARSASDAIAHVFRTLRAVPAGPAIDSVAPRSAYAIGGER